jgi:hypothetical protein
VEGYLAHKWGLTLYLPVISPLSIPGCQLWLDGADPAGTGTPPASGATVSTWVDKSLSGTVSTTASPPTFTSSGISFNGTSQYIQLSSAYTFTLSQGITLFTVSYLASNSGGFQRFFSVNESVLPNGIVWGTQNGNFVADVGNSENWNNSGSWPLSPAVVNLSNTVLISGTFTTTSETFYANGTSNTTYGVTRYSPIIPYSIGSAYFNNNPQQFWNGRISEIIMYNSVLNTSQRQSIEGYLARKWGISISATLPSLHPFKSITPATSAHFYPTDITGCQLWLDGADPAGTGTPPANGYTVSTWVDKANGKNGTATGTSTYLSGGGINFTGSSYFLNQTFAMNLSQRSIFIVMQETTHTGNRGILSFIPNPSSGDDVATTTGLAVETDQGLRFGGNLFTGAVYLSALGNPTLLVKAIYNDNMNVRTGSGYLNGTNATNVTAGYTAGTCSGYIVGRRWPEINYLNGVIYEIIVFNSALTTTQRQQVEGYLAHKWGLTSSLPSKHPYRPLPPIFPPTVQYNLTTNGGTIVSADYTTYHVFTSSSNFVVVGNGMVNYLVVGGGGGGGDRHGGGGGAGGVQTGSFSATSGTYTVTVGLGGQYGAYIDSGSTAYGSPQGAGTKGGDSLLSGTGISVTSYGGGGGGTYDGNPTGTVGSGGGGGGQNLSGVAGTAGQGNAGGAGLLPGGGGGGGAGGAGVAANTGTGGIGTTSFSTHLLAVGYGTTFAVATSPNTVISGGVAYIAGGGGGCAGTSPGPGGTGGLGGGGRGDWTDSFISAGTPNTGGGGGATRSDLGLLYSTGRNGGSGLVLLWY